MAVLSVWHKKRRGSLYLTLILHSGLRIAFPKDKQLSQPTPGCRYIQYSTPYAPRIADKTRVDATSASDMDAYVAVSSWESKLRSLNAEENAGKRLFN